MSIKGMIKAAHAGDHQEFTTQVELTDGVLSDGVKSLLICVEASAQNSLGGFEMRDVANVMAILGELVELRDALPKLAQSVA